MAARCLQHEVDHLDGTVYVDLLPEAQREQLLAEAAARRDCGVTTPEGASQRRADGWRAESRPWRAAGWSSSTSTARWSTPRPASTPRSGWPPPRSACRSRRPPQLRAMVGPPLQEGFAAPSGLAGPTSTAPSPPTGRTTWPARCSTPRPIPASRSSWTGCAPTAPPLAVATSKPEPFAVGILEHVGLLDRSPPCTAPPSTAPSGTRTRWSAPRSRATRRGSGPGARGRPGAGRHGGGGARAALHRGRLGSGRGRRAGAGRCGRDRGHPGRRRRRCCEKFG